MQKTLLKNIISIILLATLIVTLPLPCCLKDASIAGEIFFSAEEINKDSNSDLEIEFVYEDNESNMELEEELEDLLIDPDPSIYEKLEDFNDSSIPSIDLSTLDINTNLPNNYYNILILGLDARKDSMEDALSDVIMICSINKQSGEIKLTSLARDIAVIIPGYNNLYKINAAYKYGWNKDPQDGGPKLAMRTVNSNFQMNIEHFVAINFFGLSSIIDSMGGVDIELSKAEANRVNYELKKEPLDKVDRKKVPGNAGIHHLDGMQAVAYARIRKIDNDFERTARQRKLIDALMRSVMDDMDLDTLMAILTSSLPHIYTNIPMSDMLSLGLTFLSNSDFVNSKSDEQQLFSEFRIPMDKTFSYKTIRGASVISMGKGSMEKNITSLHEFIYGESFYQD